jgi:hypothetical protein
MNWRQLYATVQTQFVLFFISGTAATFWAFVAAEICRIAFGFEENKAQMLIGVPLFVALLLWLVQALPDTLRRLSMSRDQPEKFGPWYQD